MTLLPIENVAEFKRKFALSFQETREQNLLLNSFIYEISLLSNLFIVGGYLRCLANSEPVRDLDIIVNVSQVALDELIEKCFLNFRKNRMGGYKVVLDRIAVDVWSVEDNWAFKTGLVKNAELNYVDKIAEGTFFNYDSLVSDLHSFQSNFKHYNVCARTNVLDIIQRNSNYKRLNPTREANVLRAFYLVKKYKLSLSAQVVSYIIQNINYSNDLFGSYMEKLGETLMKYEKYHAILPKESVEEIVAQFYPILVKRNVGDSRDSINLF